MVRYVLIYVLIYILIYILIFILIHLSIYLSIYLHTYLHIYLGGKGHREAAVGAAFRQALLHCRGERTEGVSGQQQGRHVGLQQDGKKLRKVRFECSARSGKKNI
jgi:hypothetical protein